MRRHYVRTLSAYFILRRKPLIDIFIWQNIIMLFNSFHFLCFFPIVIAVYFVIPPKIRYIWLLLTSYYFYMSWNPKYAILIAASTLITWASGIFIDKAGEISDSVKSVRMKKAIVVISFTTNLAILVFFKYSNFLLENLNGILIGAGFEVIEKTLDVLLPVGISFYTFQALSYTADVYGGG